MSCCVPSNVEENTVEIAHVNEVDVKQASHLPCWDVLLLAVLGMAVLWAIN